MAKKSTAIDVTQGVIWQQLLSLCVPIFFSSFFQQAYTLIGTYIVGQVGGKLALGGIQATMVLTELCIWFLRRCWCWMCRYYRPSFLVSTMTSA